MYLLLAESVEAADGGTPWWAPLLGVVIGALLGGTTQLAAELLRAKNTRKEAVWAARQQVEIDALVKVEDLIHSIRETLDTVSGSDGNLVDDAHQLAAVESLFAAERQMKI
jgi:hypothetical protein